MCIRDRHPTQPSTVEAKSGYKFDKWTDDAGKSFNDDAALKVESYLENQTFTAYFKATGGTFCFKARFIDHTQVFLSVIRRSSERRSARGARQRCV